MSDLPSYRFGPRQERVAFGLSRAQLTSAAVSASIAMLLVFARHGALTAAGILVLGAAVTFAPVGGRPLVSWAPLLTSHFGARKHAVAPLARHELRSGGGITTVQRSPVARWHLPGLGALRIERVEGPLGELAIAAIGSVRPEVSFTFELTGPRFALADPHDQARALLAWGQLLDALASDNGRLRRIQVLERVEPDDLMLQHAYAGSACRLGDRRALELYRAELDALAGRALRHEVFLTVALGRLPEREVGPIVTGEAARLSGLLEDAGFEARCLTPGELAGVLRTSLDPASGAIAAAMARGDLEPHAAAPGTWHATWGGVRTDSGTHACFEAKGFPRLPVGPEWAWPLVLTDETAARRSLALHIELARPEMAIRRAERAVVNEEGDEALRSRWGFRSGARQDQAMEAVLARESELAEGFADARFALFVTVSTTDEAALEASCRAVTGQAAHSHIELQRLYGHQPAALAATLPLGFVRFRGGWR